MATVSVSYLSAPRYSLSRHNLSLRNIRSLRCSASLPENDESTSRILKLAVSGITELLRVLSPKNRREEDWQSEELDVVLNVDDVVEILRSDYLNAYFLTGKFTSGLYADDCLFADPTIKFHGKDRYLQNLELLVPSFDSPSLELEKIEKGLDSYLNYVLAKWKLRTYLRFPWRPLISIRGTTTYDLDKDFKIVRHVESWNVSALEAVGQIFALGLKDRD